MKTVPLLLVFVSSITTASFAGNSEAYEVTACEIDYYSRNIDRVREALKNELDPHPSWLKGTLEKLEKASKELKWNNTNVSETYFQPGQMLFVEKELKDMENT